MKLIFISLCVFFSCVSYSQDKKDKVDSLDLKVISMRDLEGYLKRIDLISQKQFDLTEVKKYEQILKTIQSVYAEADRKRKIK